MKILGTSRARPPQAAEAPTISVGYRQKPRLSRRLMVGGCMLLLVGGGFYIGMLYQGHTKPTNVATTTTSPSTSTTNKKSSYRVFGTVTAINSSSISVQNVHSGATVTLAITGTTLVKDGGQTMPLSSVQNGDKVIVIKKTADATQAVRIVVRPSTTSNSPAPSGSTTAYPEFVIN